MKTMDALIGDDLIIMASGWLDLLVGISGVVLTLLYDILLHRDWRIGFYAIIALIVFAFYIIKGLTQIQLAR